VTAALARRSLVRRPESWLYGVAAGAGLVLVLGIVASGPGSAAHAHHHHHHGMSMAPAPASWLSEWRGWTVMVLAMMLPVVAPHARRVAMRSLWHRRQRAIAWFVLGYLAVWLAVGAVLVWVLVAAGHPRPGPAVLATALVAAAAWQVSRPRRRVMRRCGALRPTAARGWHADRDCADAGVRVGLRCAFTCGPVMLAMAVSHGLLLMGGLLAVLLSERARGPNPDRRAGRPLEAWCLAGFAAVAGLAAVA
jgi:predicted metal-binding membrane protein